MSMMYIPGVAVFQISSFEASLILSQYFSTYFSWCDQNWKGLCDQNCKNSGMRRKEIGRETRVCSVAGL